MRGISLRWYTDERAVEPLEQARQDPDEIVRMTATWALQALQKELLYASNVDRKKANPGRQTCVAREF